MIAIGISAWICVQTLACDANAHTMTLALGNAATAGPLHTIFVFMLGSEEAADSVFTGMQLRSGVVGASYGRAAEARAAPASAVSADFR